ncbi:MAG: site-specific DNA-methyltransferase [Thermoguttaceae bacterium]|nr:site-specific DNA-methyltransferase [Thermoguttaceae bacterium]
MELLHGNCIDLLRNISDSSIDATITSPPYDNLRAYNNGCQWGEQQWKEILKQLYRVTKDGGVVVWIVNDATVNGSETGTSFKQALYAKEIGFRLYDTMIWNKQSGGYISSRNRYTASFEYMFIFTKGAPKTHNLIRDKRNKWAGSTAVHGLRKRDGSVQKTEQYSIIPEYGVRYNVWNINPVQSNTERTGHPAQFPLELAEAHVLTWSNEGDTILDPMMGSGTVGAVCAVTNRDFIGMDINKEYVDIAEKRIKQIQSSI